MAAVIGVCSGPAVQADASGTTVAFVPTRDGSVVVRATVGTTPVRMLIDTGSSHTMISEALAASIGARVVARSPLVTPAGEAAWPVVELPDVVIGRLRVSSLLATVVPAGRQHLFGPGVSGLVGQDVLARAIYTLDYRASRLVWHDEALQDSSRRLALEASGGLLLVVLPQDPGCGCVLRLVPDSGSNGLILYEGSVADRLAIRSSQGLIRVSTLVGGSSARAAVVSSLHVGVLRLLDQPAARTTRPHSDIAGGDGWLPLSMFSRVHINGPAGYMTVER